MFKYVFTPSLILQYISLLFIVYGIIVAVVVMFWWSVHQFMISLVTIFLLLLLGAYDLWNHNIFNYFNFLDNFLGRGILFIIVGCLFASNHGVLLASWIIMWIVGAANIIGYFVTDNNITNLISPEQGNQPVTNKDGYEIQE